MHLTSIIGESLKGVNTALFLPKLLSQLETDNIVTDFFPLFCFQLLVATPVWFSWSHAKINKMRSSRFVQCKCQFQMCATTLQTSDFVGDAQSFFFVILAWHMPTTNCGGSSNVCAYQCIFHVCCARVVFSCGRSWAHVRSLKSCRTCILATIFNWMSRCTLFSSRRGWIFSASIIIKK